MINLPNNCRRSAFIIHPKNWDKKDADITTTWYLKYRFYEEGKPVKPVKIRCANDTKILAERQVFVHDAVKQLTEDLAAGYNPNLKDFTVEHLGDITPDTLFFHALQYALDNAPFIPETKKEIEWVLRNTKKAADACNYLHLSIGTIRRKHIKMILDKCKKLNPELSNNSYNVFRKYLYKLFKILKQYEAVELNPVDGIEKLAVISPIRPSLSEGDEILLDKYLIKNYPSLRRFMHIFYQSGCRIKEIMRLQAKDVYLNRQEFKITTFKGRKYKEELKAINNDVLHLWQELMKGIKPNDYLFGEGLEPAATPIKAYQIHKRWNRLIKKPLGIEADFYSLKHSKITAVNDKAKDSDLSKQLTGHSKNDVIAKVYDLNANQRRLDELKKIKTPFGVK